MSGEQQTVKAEEHEEVRNKSEVEFIALWKFVLMKADRPRNARTVALLNLTAFVRITSKVTFSN